ncbi:MFS transporter [Candidatus Bathyarchaeota archaeon]|nr:MFS transporter [Candidatus Bathyarchaeota archaeon]
MNEETSNQSEESGTKFMLPSLGLSRLVLQLPRMLTGLLLIDIAYTFETSVGMMGQIRTASSIVAVVGALFMAGLSVRFRHKHLLMTGLAFIMVSALGCGLAPNYTAILVLFSLSGVGMAMVNPMSQSLIGEYLPLGQRASTMGWMLGASAAAYLIGAPVFAYISGIGGWRWAFLGFVLPLSVLSLMFAAYGLPRPRSDEGGRGGSVLEAFRAVFTSASATSCLVGNLIIMSTWSTHLSFSSSLLRQKFLVSTGFASLSTIVGATCFIAGSVSSGRLVNKVGRKRLAVLLTIPAGLLLLGVYNLEYLPLVLVFSWLGALINGMLLSATSNLTLEQLPMFRGTMMSISSATGSLGSAIGTAFGGWILVTYYYHQLGWFMGAFNLVAVLLYNFFTKDPTRDQ